MPAVMLTFVINTDCICTPIKCSFNLYLLPQTCLLKKRKHLCTLIFLDTIFFGAVIAKSEEINKATNILRDLENILIILINYHETFLAAHHNEEKTNQDNDSDNEKLANVNSRDVVFCYC